MTLVYIGIAIGVLVVLGLAFGKGAGPAAPPNLSDEDIKAMARRGQKIQAVKWYRSLHGVGLKEAKDAVERMTLES